MPDGRKKIVDRVALGEFTQASVPAVTHWVSIPNPMVNRHTHGMLGESSYRCVKAGKGEGKAGRQVTGDGSWCSSGQTHTGRRTCRVKA